MRCGRRTRRTINGEVLRRRTGTGTSLVRRRSRRSYSDSRPDRVGRWRWTVRTPRAASHIVRPRAGRSGCGRVRTPRLAELHAHGRERGRVALDRRAGSNHKRPLRQVCAWPWRLRRSRRRRHEARHGGGTEARAAGLAPSIKRRRDRRAGASVRWWLVVLVLLTLCAAVGRDHLPDRTHRAVRRCTVWCGLALGRPIGGDSLPQGALHERVASLWLQLRRVDVQAQLLLIHAHGRRIGRARRRLMARWRELCTVPGLHRRRGDLPRESGARAGAPAERGARVDRRRRRGDLNE